MDTTGFIVFSILLTIQMTVALFEGFSWSAGFATAMRQALVAGISAICLWALFTVAHQT